MKQVRDGAGDGRPPRLPMPESSSWTRRASQAGSQALSTRGSKHLRTGSHADTECWHGLFDIQTSLAAEVFSLSSKTQNHHSCHQPQSHPVWL
jgi:hypothetical protein